MANNITEEAHFFPWVRKGLANNIQEKDVFGNVEDGSLAKVRAVLTVHTKYRAYSGPDDDTGSELVHDKKVDLYGPVDVAGIASSAISLCRPAALSSGFPTRYFPYVEFREPDFPWRYTPAKVNDNRLTPWLVLLTFRADQIDMQKDGHGLSVATFRGDRKAYSRAFPEASQLWKTAHAQGPREDVPVFSRLIGLRGTDPDTGKMAELEKDTEYVACLVPSFETGRLRGLGIQPDAFPSIAAQAPAWEPYEVQKEKTRGMEFPVYYSWTFTSGGASFEEMVETLTPYKPTKEGVKVDVTHMGEGLDYEVSGELKSRKSITVPAATCMPGIKPETEYPSAATEGKVRENLRKLLISNPVFMENASDIGAEAGQEYEELSEDDPCVVPPVYGARHVMATSLEEKDHPWMTKINTDIHYRTAAGLGRKVILENQEALMDRAWKQVEAVQALNMQLYQRLLSIGANTSLHNKVVGEYGADNKYLASLMFYLGSMKEALSRNGNGKETTLSEVLEDRDVPTAFATPTFHRMTDRVSEVVSGLDTKTVMEHILEYNTCEFPDLFCRDAASIATLRKYSDEACISIFNDIWDNHIVYYFRDAEEDCSGYYVNTSETMKYIFGLFEDICSMPLETRNQPLSESVSCAAMAPSIAGVADRMDYIHFDGRTIPTSPIGWYSAFYRYAVNHGLVQRGPNQEVDACRLFFDMGLDRHPVEGTFWFSHNQYYRMVILPHTEYLQYFGGAKSITQIRISPSQDVYFSDMEFVREKGQLGICNHQETVSFFFDLPGVGSQHSDDLKVPGLLYYTYNPSTGTLRRGYFSYNGNYLGLGCAASGVKADHNSLSGGTHAIPVFSSLEESEQAEAYSERAAGYMRETPSYIQVHAEFFQDDIQTFDKDSYLAFLLDKPDQDLLSYMRMWREFDELVGELEKEYPAVETQEPEKPVVPPPTMADDIAYEEAIKVVEDYYANFYADNLTGAKLRSNYVEELLRTKYPILAYPVFPEPVYYYLKDFSTEFIIPGAANIPTDSVSLTESNSAFIEAYLAGMNTEMGRELLWREYPTDQRGSYFRKFWDSESSVDNIRKDNFFDISPMHTWKGELGSNMAEGKNDLLVFVLKGRLMRTYPATRIYLWRAKGNLKNRTLEYDGDATEANGGIIRPIMESFMSSDTLLIGFKTTFLKVLGNPANGDFGYFLAFEEDVEDLDFLIESGNDLDPALYPDAAEIANKLKNDTTIYGKHLSLFL